MNWEQAYYRVLQQNLNSITIQEVRQNLIYRPKLTLKALIGDFICNIQGKNELEMLSHYIPTYTKVSDDNEIINGMIGQRIFKYDGMFDIYQNKDKEFVCEHIIVDQYEDCLNKLHDKGLYNMSIYNRVFDENSKHPAEIQNILFYVDNDKLYATVNTNVFDVYIRFPYLAFFISNLMSVICATLKLQLGYVTINFGYIIQSHTNIKPKFIYDDTMYLVDNIISDTEIFHKVFAIELVSRIQKDVLLRKNYIEMLEDIENRYWQSLGAILIKYNVGYNVDEYILDEFKKLM